MAFSLQVIAIYLGMILFLTIVVSLAGLAVKYKIQPIGGPMLVAMGLLMATLGAAIWYFLERKP
jgi:hypothetical protein